MSNALKGLAIALSILSFFCLMSRIDFIVHETLYHYGLQFSYKWANEYWEAYTATFIAFSVIIGIVYWFGSNKTVKDLRISLGLVVTVNILMIGGLQDIMFYVFWNGGLPPNDVIWWWVPWSHLLGMWNSSMQIVFTAFTLLVTVFLWTKLFGK
ncbi:hypothetical protein KAU55_04635 [Candidatus Bathyarchaeota archaeon]|nr:hypothetical protein [Candidatus Bathyarchaeota archaeon]